MVIKVRGVGEVDMYDVDYIISNLRDQKIIKRKYRLDAKYRHVLPSGQAPFLTKCKFYLKFAEAIDREVYKHISASITEKYGKPDSIQIFAFPKKSVRSWNRYMEDESYALSVLKKHLAF